jgi:hypothetical protein
LNRTGRIDRSRPVAMNATFRSEFAQLGAKIPAPETAEEEDFDPVADCNWDSLMAFLACDTQWRVSGVGMAGLVWIGLDYTACDIVFRRRSFPDDLWDDVRIMEEAALPILNSGDD